MPIESVAVATNKQKLPQREKLHFQSTIIQEASSNEHNLRGKETLPDYQGNGVSHGEDNFPSDEYSRQCE